MRPLTPDDIDGIVDLHRQAFTAKGPRTELKDYLANVFFGHPWIDATLPSLGYVDQEGELIGCLGAMPRPMLLNGRPIRAVVTHNFVVTAGKRLGLPAIQLMRALMAAGPDLTVADGNETTRGLSEALGGTTLLGRSNRWFRILGSAGLAVHLMSGWKVPAPITRVLGGLSSAPDRLARFVPGSPLSIRTVTGIDDPLDARLLLDLLERHTQHLSLRPVYTEKTLSWLLMTLDRTRQDQTLKTGAVRVDGDAVGWYVYYSRPRGIGRVLQLGAAPGSRRLVLDHLFASAVREGNVGLSGQTDPAWTEALAASSCLTRPGSTWMLLSTSHPTVKDALVGSDAFLSRLEGEAWLHYSY